jgi:protease-4
MEVIRHGKQKCCRAFLKNKMSDNREQTTALLNSVWNSVVLILQKK